MIKIKKILLRKYRRSIIYTIFNVRPSIKFAKRHFKRLDKIAEVGSKRGVNAKVMFKFLKPSIIYLIDLENRLKDMQDINYKLILKPSVEAAADFRDESLDLVYIDADHSEDAVTLDIRAWWPKVRKNGILCGHDYTGRSGAVRRAVNKFFKPQSFLMDWWVVK